MPAVAVGRPSAVAVTCSGKGPVFRLFVGRVMVKLADVVPAAMITDAGSVSSLLSLEANDTVSGVVKVPPNCTVPDRVCPSQPEAGSVTVMVRSSSATLTVVEPLVQLSMLAVTVTGVGPDSIMWSSRSVAVKLTEIWPAGKITVAGTVSCAVSSEVNWIVTFPAGAALAVTVPLSVPPVSWAVSGKLTLKMAVSLPCTVITPEPLP